MKFYAVKKGAQCGIFTQWSVVQPLVIGYAGAVYKSFPSLEEAQHFLTGNTSGAINHMTPAKTQQALPATPLSVPSQRLIYTDGSCKKGVTSSAIIVVKEQEVMWEAVELHPGSFTNNYGELIAIKMAIDYCLDHQPEEETILYTDSNYSLQCCTQWVHTWRKNGWRTAKGTAVAHADIIDYLADNLTRCHLTMKHIYAHTGATTTTGEINWNDRVDKLAQSAVDRSKT